MVIVKQQRIHKTTTLKPTPNENKNNSNHFRSDHFNSTNFTRMKLRLPLKTEFFEMSDPDGKTEDYRDINEYWTKRFIENLSDMEFYEFQELIEALNNPGIDLISDILEYSNCRFKKFTSNVMTLGYPKSTDFSRIKEFEHLGIEIGYGKPEWGAVPNKLCFIVKHGKRL